MYDETNVPGPEYRVRPVVRYVLTRYCHPYTHGDIPVSGGSKAIGEFPKEQDAYDIARALAREEPAASVLAD